MISHGFSPGGETHPSSRGTTLFLSEKAQASPIMQMCVRACVWACFFYHLHHFPFSRWIGTREQHCHPVIPTLCTSMGAVQVHTWYSCSFLIIASVRSLTRVELYFILNEWNKAHHHFVFGTLEGVYFPEKWNASSLCLWHCRGSLFPRDSGSNPPHSLSGSH